MTQKKSPSPSKEKRFSVLLQCPGIHLAPTVVTAVVEESMIDFLSHGSGLRGWEFEEEHRLNMRDRLFDEYGDIALAAHGEELWDFMKDPDQGQKRYCDQAERLLQDIYYNNSVKIEEICGSINIKKIKVLRAFRNQWLLGITGTKSET